jgi:flagellar hook-length control protein FliK
MKLQSLPTRQLLQRAGRNELPARNPRSAGARAFPAVASRARAGTLRAARFVPLGREERRRIEGLLSAPATTVASSNNAIAPSVTEGTTRDRDAFDRALDEARRARDEERRARDAAATVPAAPAAVSGEALPAAASEDADGAAPEVEAPAGAEAPKVDDVGVGEHTAAQDPAERDGEQGSAPADEAEAASAAESAPAVKAAQIGTAVAPSGAAERTQPANGKQPRTERTAPAAAASDAATTTTTTTATPPLADRVAAHVDKGRAANAPAIADAAPKAAAAAPTPAPAASGPAPAGATTAAATTTAAPAADAAPAPPAAAPPRFIDTRTVQMVEANRASIFQQIAVRLSPAGGEMRMRLDPPELGHLDVRMIMDERGDMRLHVVAERADVTAALQQHVNELRHVLAQSGVHVAETNIQTGHRQGAGAGTHGDGSGASGGASREGAHEEDAAPSLPRGFITGGGLDFLV